MTCYYPNGTANTGFSTCASSTRFASCCLPGSECLTNGLCRHSARLEDDPIYFRNLCTDPTWQSDACPQYCLRGAAKSASAQVFTCTSTTYCCAKPNQTRQECCEAADQVFTAPPAKWLSGPQLATLTLEAITIPTTSSMSGTTSLLSSPTTSIPTISSTSSPSHLSSSVEGATSPSSGVSPIQPNQGLSTGAKAGVGVGIAVAVVLLVAALLAVLHYRRLAKRKDAGLDPSAEKRDLIETHYGSPSKSAMDQSARGFDGRPYVEAEAGHGFAEMPHDRAPVELMSATGRHRAELMGSDFHVPSSSIRANRK